MDIKDRITHIISKEQLSASSFADSIGVQRSSISHILSGRNKPSLDFLQKIIKSYPKYSAEWLITGDGNPLKELKQSTIFDNLPSENTEISKKSLQDEDKVPYFKKAELKHIKADKPAPEVPKEPDVTDQNTSLKSFDKPDEIERIVIFYKDQSFKEYRPK